MSDVSTRLVLRVRSLDPKAVCHRPPPTFPTRFMPLRDGEPVNNTLKTKKSCSEVKHLCYHDPRHNEPIYHVLIFIIFTIQCTKCAQLITHANNFLIFTTIYTFKVLTTEPHIFSPNHRHSFSTYTHAIAAQRYLSYSSLCLSLNSMLTHMSNHTAHHNRQLGRRVVNHEWIT